MEWVDSKFDRFLVLSICILGFLTHNVFIFKGIVDAQLVENGYFKVMRNFRLPSAVFCFDLSKVVIDENHRITGNHLNSLKEELRLSNMVEKVAFFNRTHYKHFKPERGSNNYSDSEITIRPIHLFDDFHCLEFQLNVIFDEEDYYIILNKFLIHIYFTHWFVDRVRKTYLFNRQAGKKEVSDLVEYDMITGKWGWIPIYELS